ncbi:MAG: DUF456 domain-containing protein [Limnochordia bacterium]
MAFVIVIILFILGLLGAVLPVLPGAPLIWLGIFLHGYWTHWQAYGWSFLLAQGILALGASVVDWYLAGREVSKVGRPGPGIVFLGMLLGPIILGPFGFFLGPLLAVGLWQLIRGESWSVALYQGWRAMVGLFKGALWRLAIELAMISWFFLRIRV